jgi:hypothetical protein
VKTPRLFLIPLGIVLAALLGAAPALAASPSWRVEATSTPTNFAAVDNATCAGAGIGQYTPCDALRTYVTNVGAGATDGSPITITDDLPPGLTVKGVSFFWHGQLETADIGGVICTNVPLRCVLPTQEFGLPPVGSDETLLMVAYVTVDEPEVPAVLENQVTVGGGGAAEVSASGRNEISPRTPPFGFSHFDALATSPLGAPSLEAAGHPYDFRTTIVPNSTFSSKFLEGAKLATSVRDLRDAVVDLPPGFFGSALAAPTCNFIKLVSQICPADTIVGHLRSEPEGGVSIDSPIYNLVPEPGYPAEFGYRDLIANSHVLYPTVVPSGGGYVLRVSSPEIPQVDLNHIEVVFYGDPTARDAGREPEPGDIPFFTNPSACEGQSSTTTIHIDSWQQPALATHADGSPDFADPGWASASSEAPAVTGCERLHFEPTIAASPTNVHADSPSGLDVRVKVPQVEEPQTPATPPLRDAVITLPAGLTVNPSSANGLAACSLAQIGMSPSGLPDGAQPSCPEASKLGTVELETPAIAGILHGEIYLARQDENPFGSLIAIYIVVDDPATGVLVKIPAEVKPDPQTGQLTTTVTDSPQFPFSELRTHFFSGDLAPLRTPSTCGTFAVGSQLTPWSAPQSGPAATPSADFTVSAPATGTNCPQSAAQEPNSPSFEAGTENPAAGAYSPFVLKLSRGDGSQELTGIDTTLPKGLLGRLTGVPYCPDGALAAAAGKSGVAEQSSPSCPSASQVGVVDVGAGAGPKPFYVQGKAYLAGPYKGAPLSLAIITPAVAGPFDLGTVVVRTALDVDPFTAQIHAVSGPFPHILQGIPLDIRSIALTMNRPNFTLNPTSCDPSQVTGGATSLLGNVAPLSVRFQVGGCAALKFRPQLKLSLKGSTRHAGHPALKAVLTYPQGGGYANIARAQVNLPHSEFIDQANLNRTCTRPVLLAGACPASTIYGRAKAWTPLEQAPLEGPVYLVGGFGYKLPAMVAELNGQIRVLLAGKVDSGPNHGIRNTFEAVPDAPVERFELNLKGGPKYSLLENSEDLCARPQRAIARFTAQNGAVLQTKPLIANQCAKKSKKSNKKGAGKKKSKGAGAKK